MNNEWPFVASEALDAEALSFRELRSVYRAEHPGIWVPRGIELNHEQRGRAAWLWSGRNAVIGGGYASALLGAKWVEVDTPVELIHSNRRPPRGIVVHSDRLLPNEVRVIGGLPVTTADRTAYDLGRWHPERAAVLRIDALMNATGLAVGDVAAVAARHPHARGLRMLCKTLELVDGGAESPYESLTRLLLRGAGFPPVQTQLEVRDEYGRVFARIDMGWPEYRVGVDFEGAHHWTDAAQRSWDIERFAKLPDLGWIDERLTSGILHNRPQTFLDRVGAALVSRGCPKTW